MKTKTDAKTPPLCVDCANYAPNRRVERPPGVPDVKQPLCGVDCIRLTAEVNLVEGKPVYRRYDQSTERSHGKILCRVLGTCGKEGRFFRSLNAEVRNPHPKQT